MNGWRDSWSFRITRRANSWRAARAALRFKQGLADWPEALLQKTTPVPLRATLQAAVRPPVPPPRERAMVPQPIDFWHPLTGPVKAFLKFIQRLYRC